MRFTCGFVLANVQVINLFHWKHTEGQPSECSWAFWPDSTISYSCICVGVPIPFNGMTHKEVIIARVKSYAAFDLNDLLLKEHGEVKTQLRYHVHSISSSQLSHAKYIFAECVWIMRRWYLVVKITNNWLCLTSFNTRANPTMTEAITSWWITLLLTDGTLNLGGQILYIHWSCKDKRNILFNLSLCRWKQISQHVQDNCGGWKIT